MNFSSTEDDLDFLLGVFQIMLNQFSNLSCYKEFEMRCALTGISKVDALKIIGNQINDYYFVILEDGIFNWFDLEGNHVENPCVLKSIKEKYIPKTITKCIIPNGVTRISNNTFLGCDSLKEIIIPNSVANIGEWAFCACKSLTSITIPNSITYISHEVFKYCISLKEVFIPNNVTSIGVFAFLGCESLEKIVIPNSLTRIGERAFSQCGSLTSITIPNSVTSIGEYTFCDCNSLKYVIFKSKNLEKVKRMENYPFGIEDESIIMCEM